MVDPSQRMTGSDIDNLIREACQRMRLQHYHVTDSRMMNPGLADWIIQGDKGTIVREVKGEHLTSGKYKSLRIDQLSLPQETSLDRWKKSGVDARVWTADDWRSGLILDELGALR